MICFLFIFINADLSVRKIGTFETGCCISFFLYAFHKKRSYARHPLDHLHKCRVSVGFEMEGLRRKKNDTFVGGFGKGEEMVSTR